MLDTDFLAAISHPVRMGALVMCERRPTTVRELADDLGLKPTAAGHHMRKLADAGLIVERELRQRNGFVETAWVTRISGWSSLADALDQLQRRQARASR